MRRIRFCQPIPRKEFLVESREKILQRQCRQRLNAVHGGGCPGFSPAHKAARDDFTWMFQQNSEDLKWLFLQRDSLSVFFAQFSRRLVEFEAGETNDSVGGS